MIKREKIIEKINDIFYYFIIKKSYVKKNKNLNFFDLIYIIVKIFQIKYKLIILEVT